VQKCYEYLVDLKWKNGYSCQKCGNAKHCAGLDDYGRQCAVCNNVESATAGTLFHKCKFSILKAFYIVYYVSTNKKGIASTELSRKLGLRQKTTQLSRNKYVIQSI